MVDKPIEPMDEREDEPVLHEIVPPALDGERIDRVVALLADVSRNRASIAIAAGAVRLCGAVVTQRSRKVRADEELVVDGLEREAVHAPEGDATVVVSVLYEDDDVIVVD